MVISIISLLISSLVAIAVIYREFIHDWLYRPKLEIIFSLEEPISRERVFGRLGEPPQKHFWQRLRVKNNGRGVAWRCEGVLAEVRNPRGELVTRYEPLSLEWAIFKYEGGIEPMDITPGKFVDLNILITIENTPHAIFPTGVRGDPYYHDLSKAPFSAGEYLEPGDYWLRIVIYGKNFKPIERGYAVHWDGKNYKGIDTQEMNEMPKVANKWPWPILEKTESSI